MRLTPEIARQALGHPNVKAFLRMLRVGEGTSDDDGYSRHFGGELVADWVDDDGRHRSRFEKHPQRRITKLVGGSPITSTACGAYQFLSKTWEECQAALGLPDFSPESQDLAAVFLINRRGALDDVMAGKLEAAIALCAKEWASLPGSPYGQPVVTMERCRQEYERWGGQYSPVATPQAPQEPAPAPKEKTTMPIPAIIAALLPTLIEQIPRLGKLFGSGSEVAERNVAAATTVMEIVQTATGAANAQAAVEAIVANPAVREQATQAVEAQWFQLHQATEASTEKAREFSVTYAQTHNVRTVLGNLTFLEVLSLLLVVSTLAGGMSVLLWGGIDAQLKGAVVTLMLIGGYTSVTNFWYGSSLGSKKKDDKEQV